MAANYYTGEASVRAPATRQRPGKAYTSNSRRYLEILSCMGKVLLSSLTCWRSPVLQYVEARFTNKDTWSLVLLDSKLLASVTDSSDWSSSGLEGCKWQKYESTWRLWWDTFWNDSNTRHHCPLCVASPESWQPCLFDWLAIYVSVKKFASDQVRRSADQYHDISWHCCNLRCTNSRRAQYNCPSFGFSRGWRHLLEKVSVD